MVAIGIFCHNSSNFDEKQYIFVETLLATSKFDGYSDFKTTMLILQTNGTFVHLL